MANLVTIRSRQDFLRVQNNPDIRVRNHSMLLLGKNMEAKSIENISVENSRESSRIGFVVTKKVDKRATVRNRIRRRIKAILRAILLNHCNLYINHVDYVMIVLEDFSSISYDELFSSVRKLFGEFKVKYDRRIH